MDKNNDKNFSKTLGDILDECLEVRTENCVGLVARWYRSNSKINYSENQPSIDPKKMLDFMNYQYGKSQK